MPRTTSVSGLAGELGLRSSSSPLIPGCSCPLDHQTPSYLWSSLSAFLLSCDAGQCCLPAEPPPLLLTHPCWKTHQSAASPPATHQRGCPLSGSAGPQIMALSYSSVMQIALLLVLGGWALYGSWTRQEGFLCFWFTSGNTSPKHSMKNFNAKGTCISGDSALLDHTPLTRVLQFPVQIAPWLLSGPAEG